jgi:hypothetical protein
MLDLFGLEITFSMKIKWNYFLIVKHVYLLFWFNILCKYTKLHEEKPNLLNTIVTYYIYIIEFHSFGKQTLG